MREKDREHVEVLLHEIIDFVLGNECEVPVGRNWTLVIEYEDGKVACLSDTTQPASELQSKIFDIVGA